MASLADNCVRPLRLSSGEIADQPFPAVDFAAFPSSSGPATAGVYRNLGNVPQFDVAGYPEDEVSRPRFLSLPHSCRAAHVSSLSQRSSST